MRALRPLALALPLLLLLSAGPARAHKVNIFAYVDGADIVTDSFFSKDSKVISGKVNVLDAKTGEVLASGVTDAKGGLTLPVPRQAIESGHDLKLVLVAGEGHQGDIMVRASEFAALRAAGAAAPKADASAPQARPGQKAEPKPAAKGQPASPAPSAPATPAAQAAPAALDEAALRRIVAEAVAQSVDQAVESRLAPVKRLLAENVQKGPGPTEIAGGIGYIVGLFGIAAYAASRRKGGSGK